MGWIGCDLDGTLAKYSGWQDGAIGAPIPAMVERVKQWLAEGKDVRIFTARAGILDAISPESLQRADREFAERQVSLIEEWCEQHIGRRLPVTACKDFMLLEIWDDRAVQVRMNTGERIEDNVRRQLDAAVALLREIKPSVPFARETWHRKVDALLTTLPRQEREDYE